MTPEEQLVEEVGIWGAANFDVHDPWLGMVEELGEISHCLLKRKQKIRGFENEEYFKEQLYDAIGDFGVYAAHHAFIHKLKFVVHLTDIKMSKLVRYSDNANVGGLLYALAYLQHGKGKEDQDWLTVSIKAITILGKRHGIDFMECTQTTWQKVVSKRNWRTSPATGV